MESSSDSDEDSSESNNTSSDLDLMKLSSSSNLDREFEIESSFDSNVGGDPWELERKPGDLWELYFVMDNTRYFFDRFVTAKSIEFACQFFHDLPNKMFRQITRMDKPSFFHLVDMIKEQAIFHNNARYRKAPVELQLAVTLDRLGHQGNSACLLQLIPTWGVSNSSLCTFTKRCFVALEKALADQIEWPNVVENSAIQEEFGKLEFLAYVGLIDGSLLPLSQRPKTDGECYFDRKS